MLELSKKVLTKVSFDRQLFRKELEKAVGWLKHEDASKLRIWCLASFAVYGDIITDVYDSVTVS